MRTTETTGNPFFDRFWAAYPKKVGKEKARRAFEKVHPTEDQLVRMLEAITEQSRVYSWSKATWKYIPHPATWLNQKRWEDEVIGETVVSEDGCYGADIFSPDATACETVQCPARYTDRVSLRHLQ